MMKVPAFFVVSAYNNDVSWVGNYTNRYLIYDKSHTLNVANTKIIQIENVGYNCFDICHFIAMNYEKLPPLVAFLEGNPFEHCKKETFDKLIYNTTFTPIEDYSHVPESHAHKKAEDGGYMEINNSWYMSSHAITHGTETRRYKGDYNSVLDNLFEDVEEYPEWIRFAPGGQYIVPRENILVYSKFFYYKIMEFVGYQRIPAESHMIERMLYYIFTNKWRERV